MTVTVSNPRLYIAGLPECPLHSIHLKLKVYLTLVTSSNTNIKELNYKDKEILHATKLITFIVKSYSRI